MRSALSSAMLDRLHRTGHTCVSGAGRLSRVVRGVVDRRDLLCVRDRRCEHGTGAPEGCRTSRLESGRVAELAAARYDPASVASAGSARSGPASPNPVWRTCFGGRCWQCWGSGRSLGWRLGWRPGRGRRMCTTPVVLRGRPFSHLLRERSLRRGRLPVGPSALRVPVSMFGRRLHVPRYSVRRARRTRHAQGSRDCGPARVRRRARRELDRRERLPRLDDVLEERDVSDARRRARSRWENPASVAHRARRALSGQPGNVSRRR